MSCSRSSRKRRADCIEHLEQHLVQLQRINGQRFQLQAHVIIEAVPILLRRPAKVPTVREEAAAVPEATHMPKLVVRQVGAARLPAVMER